VRNRLSGCIMVMIMGDSRKSLEKRETKSVGIPSL
jgi:hypothetical protein